MNENIAITQKLDIDFLCWVSPGDAGDAAMRSLNGRRWFLCPIIHVQDQVRFSRDIYKQFPPAVRE